MARTLPGPAALKRRNFLAGLAGALLVAPPRAAVAATRPGERDVLLVIDMQNCFLPGGSLPVRDGAAILPIINGLAPKFAHLVLTQDWHTPGHASFASAHAGKQPFETIEMPYGAQVLWPDHCVQGTEDAALAKDLDLSRAELIIRKGYHRQIDSYSAFREADGKTPTGLGGYLRQRGIRRVFLAGLATDFCVAFTATDACKEGFQALVIEDACRAIDSNNSLAKARAAMSAAGVRRITSADLA